MVVVILNGRYAGKKAVIVKNSNPTTAFESSFTFQWSAKGYGWKAKASSSTRFNYGSKPSFSNPDNCRHIPQPQSDIFSWVVGTKERGYGHAIVAGVERYPLKITKNMGKKRVAKRSKVKPFIKVINYNHVMPTRYGLELETLKSAVTLDSFKEPSQREEAKKAIKKLFEERYNSGKNKWFFTKLRF
ncbi:hypothetical protein BGZ54_006726 [Gamsiella multidivaricata]|nr:hypothetical protein BGZ54_006726 [Gamsiella multidivaricata]